VEDVVPSADAAVAVAVIAVAIAAIPAVNTD
jgi:hypothetical protein